MATKRGKKSAKSIKGLPVKGLSGKQAKGVKGGVIAIIAPSSNPKGGGELLPYIEQKVRS
jgi:hypothetical protein